VGAWSAAVTAEHPVRPLDEVLHVRAVFVAAVVLSPGQFALEQARVDRRHQRRPVILLLPDVPHAKQPKDGARRDRRHVTALLIEPIRVATRGYAVADEGRSRGAKSNQFMSVHGQITCVLAAEGRFGGPVLQKVPRHPMVSPGAGEVLDRLAKVAPVQLGAALS
jgi:hypothetical protein